MVTKSLARQRSFERDCGIEEGDFVQSDNGFEYYRGTEIAILLQRRYMGTPASGLEIVNE